MSAARKRGEHDRAGLFASIDSGVGDGASDLGREALRCAEEGNKISRREFDICLRGLCGKAGEDLAHIHPAPSGTELDDCLGTIPNAPEPHAHSMRSLTFPTMAARDAHAKASRVFRSGAQESTPRTVR